MRIATVSLLVCLPMTILTACGGTPSEDDPTGSSGGGGAGVGGTSSGNGGSGANGVGGTAAGGSAGSGPSVMAPEVFAELAGTYEADLSGATAIVCGSLLPIFGGTADATLSMAGIDCGKAGLHRVEVTEAGAARFLDTTEPIEFVWDNRATQILPGSTRLNGGVQYNGTGRNLTMMYPSADNLTFDALQLRFAQIETQEPGELGGPLTRIE